MRITALILAAVCCAGCPTLGPQGAPPSPTARPVTEIKTAGPYVHPLSGFVFPETFAEFHRASIHQYGSAGDDVSVGYNVEEPELQIALTFYVYPPLRAEDGRSLTLAEQFELERDGVVKYHEGTRASPARKTAVMHAESVPGLCADLQYREVFAHQYQPVSSLLYLFSNEGWSVKYRISYPSSQEARARAIAEAFVSSFPWKGGA